MQLFGAIGVYDMIKKQKNVVQSAVYGDTHLEQKAKWTSRGKDIEGGKLTGH
jgi:hypothetical protein